MNSSNNSSDIPFDKVEIVLYYITIIIPTIGVFTNSICIAIFIAIIKTSSINCGHMYKFLFIKSICDFIAALIDTLYIFFSNDHSQVDNSYLAHFFNIYIYVFFYNIFAMLSTYCEVFAAIDCFLIVSKKLQCYKRNCVFYWIISIVTVLSVLAPLYFCFRKEIVLNSDHIWEENLTSLVKTKIYVFLTLALTLPRDVFSLIILVIINILILVELKKSTSRRLTLNNGYPSTMVHSAQTAEYKKVKMILFTGFIYLTHLPSALQRLEIIKPESIKYFTNIKVFLLDLSLTIPIIPYIIFNQTFNRYFHKFISFLKF
jgi:hypothetical protein